MSTILSEGYRKARKDHDCNASDWLINSGMCDDEFTEDELISIESARANKWKIKKGDEYFRQGQIFDGEMITFKAIPAIDNICKKYDFYEGF